MADFRGHRKQTVNWAPIFPQSLQVSATGRRKNENGSAGKVHNDIQEACFSRRGSHKALRFRELIAKKS